MSVLLINPFTVPLDKADEFVRDWTKTTEVYSKPGSGLIETHMHRRTGVGSASFEFINIATWESTAAFEAAHAAYGPSEEKIPGVVAHPALYEAIINDVFVKAKAASKP